MSIPQSAVEEVLAGLRAAGVSVACYLPDSLLAGLYPALVDAEDIRAIPVTRRRRRIDLRRIVVRAEAFSACHGELGHPPSC